MKMNLKHYKCRKEVHATPMTLGEYNCYRANSSSDFGDNPKPGYLVVYSMGTDDEHQTWQHKKAFDEAYTEIK